MCVDYRGLNAITIKNCYPLPLITKIMDQVAGAQYFSKLDLKDAYHQICIKAGDEWKTAFQTCYGHYEFLVIPFGLTNAPTTFQAYINKALQGLVNRFCIVYLDDILIFSKTVEEHHQHIQDVLHALDQAGLKLKASKCHFDKSSVLFVGFKVDRHGIHMAEDKVWAIKEWGIL